RIEETVLDDGPIDRVVHVVEDVDVADTNRVIADLCGVLAAARLQVWLPPQPVHIGGALQTFNEVIGNARRTLGVAVDVDPERLGLHQAALAAIYAYPH